MKKAIVIIAMLLSFIVSSADAWWSVPTGFSGSTHYQLTNDAQNLLNSADYPDVVTKFGADIRDWTSGSTDDKRAHNKDSDNPATQLNPLLNGGPIGDWRIKAQNKYKQFNFDNTSLLISGDWSSYYYVALIMHLIEDQAVPAHAYDIKHGSTGYMDNVEQMADSNYNPNAPGIRTAGDSVSNYDDAMQATLDRTVFNEPNSYWRAYWQYGNIGLFPTCSGYISVYGGSVDDSWYAQLMGYGGCPTDAFPVLWTFAGNNERNLLKDQLSQAVSYTSGAFIALSQELPPLIDNLAISGTLDTDGFPIIDMTNGSTISFNAYDNRTKRVNIFLMVDDQNGPPITSLQYASSFIQPDPIYGKFSLNDNANANNLPYDGSFSAKWDGKLADGTIPSDGQHMLFVKVVDEDNNDTLFTDTNGDLNSYSRIYFTIQGPPRVESTLPASGASGVSTTSPITVIFNHDMDPATATNASITISPSVSNMALSWTDSKTLTISSSLTPGTNYSVTVYDSFKDIHGIQLDGDGDGQTGGSYSFSFTTKGVGYSITFFDSDYFDGSQHWVKAGDKAFTVQVTDNSGNAILTATVPKITCSGGAVTFSNSGASSVWAGTVTVAGGDGLAAFSTSDSLPLTGITKFMIDTTSPTLEGVALVSTSCTCPYGPIAFQFNATDSGSGVADVTPVGLGLYANGCFDPEDYEYGASLITDKVGNSTNLIGSLSVIQNKCTNPDDNYSVTIRNISGLATSSIGIAGKKIALLGNGYVYATQRFLADKINTDSTIINPDFSPDIYTEYPLLIIPTGGLSGLIQSEGFKARLAEYASKGGSILAFSQNQGYDFSALPGGSVTGYGYSNDQQCFANAAYIENWHQILSGQGNTNLDLNVDGFYTGSPETGQSLLTRVSNGQSALVLYPYGQGQVISTTMYTDWGYSVSQYTTQEVALIRDIIAWAKKPMMLPEAHPGETILVPVTAMNSSSTDGAIIKIVVRDPSKNIVAEIINANAIAAGESVELTIPYTSQATAPLGIWWVNYAVLDDKGIIIQPEQEGARFAIATRPQSPAQQAGLSFSVLSDSENYIVGGNAVFTIMAFNSSSLERTIIVEYDGNRQTLTAPPQGTASISYAKPIKNEALLGNWLTASFFSQDGAYLDSAVKMYRSYQPSPQVAVHTNAALYDKSETVTIITSLKINSPVAWQSDVKIKIIDSKKTTIFEETKTVDYVLSETKTLSTSFKLPAGAPIGTYTVKAEVWQGNNYISSGSCYFALPQSQLLITHNVPSILITGPNTLSFIINNTGRTTVSAGIFDINLQDPDGITIYSGSLPFAVASGGSLTLNVPIAIPALVFGNYILTFTQSDETKAGVPVISYYLNNVDILTTLDELTYRKGTNVDIQVLLTNRGVLNLTGGVLSVSVPGVGYSYVRDILTLHPGSQYTPCPIRLPADVSPGQYDVIITYTLPSGSARSITRQIIVLPPMITMEYSGAEDLKSGDTVTVMVTNNGGVDTTITGNLYFADLQWGWYYDLPINDTIPAGESKPYTYQLPPQAVNGRYELSVYVTDPRDQFPQYLDKMVTVTGIQAELAMKTGKDTYFSWADIDTHGLISNQSYTIDSGNLHMQIIDRCVLFDYPASYHRRYDAQACRTAVLWEADVPVTMPANIVTDLIQTAPALRAGQYYLQGTLRTVSGQLIGAAEYPFTATDGGVGFHFRTDKTLYRPGETITITGEVVGLYDLALQNMTVNLYAYPNILYTETLDLPASGSHTFTFTTVADDYEGKYQFYGEVSADGMHIADASRQYESKLPILYAWPSAPAVADSSSFPLRVYFYNDGQLPGTVTFSISGGSLSDTRTLTIQPGEQSFVEYTQAITGDTIYTVDVSGDLADSQQVSVVYGEGASLVLNAQALSPEGTTPVPVTITNTGQIDETVLVNYRLMQGPAIVSQETRTYVVLIANSRTDTLAYELVEGDYQLIAESLSPSANAQTFLSVRKATSLQMTASLGEQAGGLFPATAILTNNGLNTFDGSVRVTVLSSMGDAAWEASQGVSGLIYQNSSTIAFNIDPAAMTPGDYTVRITLLDNSGLEHAKQDRTLSVRAAAFELTQVPPYWTFNSGQEASFTFNVKNTGNQEGAAELNLKAYDLIDSTRLEWLKPGEEKEISFNFLLPSDLEEKDYFAEYELKGQGLGFKGQVKYHLAGINIGVNASLDKQDYVVNDTARLTLQLTDGRAQTSDVNLFARVNYNGYEEQRQFTLNGSQMLTFDVPLAQITGEKLFYGIYHESGRSVHLNSLYVYEAGQMLTISTDKQVYESGETIAVSIQGQGAGGQGTMTLVGPNGYSETFAFNGSASKSIALLPMMTGGTYMINAQLQTSSSERVTASHPIDVNGIQVKIIEANLDKGKYAGTDTIMANLTITSNADLAATLKTWLVDPQGKKTAAGEQPIALTTSAPLLVTHKAQLSTTISGIHRLVYDVYSGDMLFSAGAEVFDVGDAVLLSIVSDKVEYSTNTKPAMAGLNMFGTVNANLELQLDGQTISSTIVALQGFVTLSLPLGTVTTGSHVLTGVLTTGNLTSTKETSFIVRQMDITPPTTAIFIGAPKYETSSMTFVTNISQFTLSARDDFAVIIKTEYRIDGGTWTSYVPFTISTAGNHTIEYRSLDNAGNLETAKSLTVMVDTISPAGTVSINGGALSTNTASVQLTLSCNDASSGCAQMMFSSDNSAWTTPEVYGTAKTWQLPLGDELKTVYVRFTDVVGNHSSAYNTNITLDTTPPTTTAAPASGIYNGAKGIVLTSSELGTIYYTTDGTTPTTSSAVYGGPITVSGNTALKFLAIDIAGNSETPVKSAIYTIDSIPPFLTLSMLPDGAFTNNATLNIAGTATDNIGLQNVMISNTTVTVNADGTFSRALKLVNGSNTITTVATDVAGNTTTDVRTIILDQSAPVITIIHPPDNSITNEVTTTVTGTVDKMSTVSIKINNTSLVPVSVTDSTFSYPVVYDYGQNTIEVTATDFAGNIGTAKRTVTFDNLSPALAITNPAQDITTKQANILLQGTVADLTIIEVTITCDGITYTPTVAAGLFEQQLTFTEENTYTAIVTATDTVGNTSTVQRNIIYDKTPPILTINPVKTPTNTSQQMVNGTMELNSTVTVTCATSVVGVVSYPTDTTWQVVIADTTEGTNLITVMATDQTGNVSGPVSAAILLDIHAPITTPNPAAGTYNSALSVTLTANEPVTIYYTTDGTTPTTDSTVYIGAIVIVSTSTVKLFAIDTAGNREAVKSAVYTIMSDITPPTTIITTGNPQYAEGGGKFYVTSATAFMLSATDDLSGVAKTEYRLDNGSWTISVSPIMLATEGSHTIGYRSADNTANFEIEKNLGVVVDNTPPASTISLGASPVTVSTEISITVADSASGVRLTEYAVDGGSWTTYNGGFTLAEYSQGMHIINYRSTDNVTNVEKTKSQSMQLWTERPTITTPSLADGTTAATYSQTLAASGAPPPYTWLLAAGTLPAGLVLNGTTGTISGTPTYAGTSSMTLQVMDIHGMTNTKDLSITIYNSLTITTSALPAGVTGTAYSQTLTATGGKAPSIWSISIGALPTGLTMNSSTGVMSGTPTSAGTFTFTAQVTDSGKRTNAKIFAIVISNSLSITTTSLPSGSTCSTYNQTLTASGGKTPYTWSVTAGSLSAGLSLNSSTGVISGTPKTAGISNFTIQVKDAINVTIAKTLSITISGPLTISTVSLPTGTIGTGYSQTVTATGGKTPYTWSIKAGSLPAGLSLAGSTGLVSGAPTTAGTSNFTVQVKDAINATSAKSLSITIYAPLTISTSSLPGGTTGAAYSQTLAATGGKTPYTWSMASGSLPAGLSLAGSTGVISGTPTTTGTSTFTVQVKDANNTTSTKTLSIIIYAPLSISTSTLPAGTKGAAYSRTLTASGGKTPYTWSISSGSLPTGLTLNSSTGMISGTPTKKGKSSFTVKVTDANAKTATKLLSITVN